VNEVLLESSTLVTAPSAGWEEAEREPYP